MGGYGFVEFTDPIYASVCMDVCNGKKFNGRPIKVDQGKKKDVEDLVFIKKNKKLKMTMITIRKNLRQIKMELHFLVIMTTWNLTLYSLGSQQIAMMKMMEYF